MKLTRAQRLALYWRVWRRTLSDHDSFVAEHALLHYSAGPPMPDVQICFPTSALRSDYRALRRKVQRGWDGEGMVQFAGMWLGIEPDGHTHS